MTGLPCGVPVRVRAGELQGVRIEELPVWLGNPLQGVSARGRGTVKIARNLQRAGVLKKF
jgi:hypothetical protein